MKVCFYSTYVHVHKYEGVSCPSSTVGMIHYYIIYILIIFGSLFTTSLVLFSVNMTTVGAAGETVTVNCTQTGYIRTQWRWWRNGTNISSTPSERVYTEFSARTKLGPITGNTVRNHQSLFLHLRYARVMDNERYTCTTETDTQTLTVNVQAPGTYRQSSLYNIITWIHNAIYIE